MKRNFTLLIFLFTLLLSAQNKIRFNYDEAGNQILREICITCGAKMISKADKEMDSTDFILIDQIFYYPNPVSEELFLKWELIEDKRVAKIQLITLTGKILQSYSPLTDQMSIGFQAYPSGLYLIQFTYNNDEQKIIKIIKK